MFNLLLKLWLRRWRQHNDQTGPNRPQGQLYRPQDSHACRITKRAPDPT